LTTPAHVLSRRHNGLVRGTIARRTMRVERATEIY
jgi:hypothetical protein